MNSLRHIATFWFALLFLAPLSAFAGQGEISSTQVPLDDDMSRRSPEAEPEVYPTGQAPSDGAFLPEGIEATGDTAEVRALTAWAKENQYRNPTQVEQAARRTLALARNLDDQRGIAETLTILGNLLRRSDPGEAEDYFTAAREAFERLGDERGVIRNRLHMGNVYRERGEAERALTAFFDALEGFKRLGDTEGEAVTLNNIGWLYQQQENREEALRHYEQAAALAETVGNPEVVVYTLSNVGIVLSEGGSYENAEIQLRQALTVAEEQDLRVHTAFVSNNLGYVLNKQGRYQDALPHLHTAEELSRELEDTQILIAVTDELGKAYMGVGRYDDALRYAHESLTLAQEGGELSRQMDAHQTLSQIYEAAGDEGQALAHYRRFAAARDSAFTAEKAEIVTEVQTRYETEEKQRAIERLEQESRIRTLQLILLLGAVVVALLIAGLFYYRYRIKQKANRLLEELDAAKSRFFTNISHEFRTPLTVILGGLQDNIAGRHNGGTKKFTEEQHAMLRNTRQLQRLIDEVLDLNRLEAGKLTLNPVPGDLVRSVRRIVEADAPLAERNGIDLTFDRDVEYCPRLYDQAKVEKIVGNLLSNALKFTPKGGVVQVALHCNDDVEVSVSDNGPGIPEEAREKVFERFAQMEDGSYHGGTGIGLALARELTELHGGTITLESESGEGSTFTVRLPLEKVDFDDVGALRETPSHQNPETLPPEEFAVGGDGHKKRQDVEIPPNGDVGATLVVAQQTEETKGNPDRTTVLIIEDNDDVRAYIRRSLRETYRVLEVVDGEDGLQQAHTEMPDLIVSDVMLPGIDGYEVVRRLKAEPDTECIPVVMLTARAAEEDKTEGYGSGAEVYITKPFSPDTLRAAIARLLEERRRLRERFRENGVPPSEEEEKPRSPLEARLREIVEARLSDPEFNPEALAEEAAFSYLQLYRRLRDELDVTPSQFIRRVRVEVAAQLLLEGSGTISEVAYAVGFNSLSYFNRNFRERFDMAPSEYIASEA